MLEGAAVWVIVGGPENYPQSKTLCFHRNRTHPQITEAHFSGKFRNKYFAVKTICSYKTSYLWWYTNGHYGVTPSHICYYMSMTFGLTHKYLSIYTNHSHIYDYTPRPFWSDTIISLIINKDLFVWYYNISDYKQGSFGLIL